DASTFASSDRSCLATSLRREEDVSSAVVVTTNPPRSKQLICKQYVARVKGLACDLVRKEKTARALQQEPLGNRGRRRSLRGQENATAIPDMSSINRGA